MSHPGHLPIAPPRDSLLERVLFVLSIGLGLGAVRKSPGTIGSLLGPLLVLACQRLSLHPLWMLNCGVILFLVGLPVCAAGIRHYQTGDPKHVVFDEIAAFPFIYLFVPITWGTAMAGFLLFRLFDIAKPWPVSRFERLPGAWGVMSDDLVAGLIAGAILALLHLTIGSF